MQTNKITRNFGKVDVQRGHIRIPGLSMRLIHLLISFPNILVCWVLFTEYLALIFINPLWGGNYIFPPSYFQYLFFHLKFNLLGEVFGLCLGKLLVGLMPELWVTLKSRQHQTKHGHEGFFYFVLFCFTICTSVSYIQCHWAGPWNL